MQGKWYVVEKRMLGLEVSLEDPVEGRHCLAVVLWIDDCHLCRGGRAA